MKHALTYPTTATGIISEELYSTNNIFEATYRKQPSTSIQLHKIDNMNSIQAKLAIFIVNLNDDNKVISSEFIEEVWVEKTEGCSLDILAIEALTTKIRLKETKNIRVREVYSVSL